jgi:hypothetical protein
MRFIFMMMIFALSQICLGQSKGGRWEFENNGDDTAIWDLTDNNGSLMNSAGYSDSLPLQQGGYYVRLDNTQPGDYIKVEDSNDLDFDNENVGISAWIYPFVLVNDVYFLVNKGQQDANPKTTNYALRISMSQNLEFLIRDANNQAQTVASSFTIPLNQWTFVAVYYDYTNSTVYFWNAPTTAATDTLTFNQNIIPNTHPLAIGGWYSAGTALSKPFKGRMDDVRISGRMEDLIPELTPVEDITGIRANPPFDIQVSVYPNPLSSQQGANQFTVDIHSLRAQQLTITVFNILGQKLYQTRFFNDEEIFQLHVNMQSVLGEKSSAGFYFISVEGKHSRQIKKLLILK